MELPFKISQSIVVFEGLDCTGKSTQMERFERASIMPDLGVPLYDPAPFFTHQPSGASGIGPDIYELTERVDWSSASPLTRQYLHLAAHTEHYEHDIMPTFGDGRSVWMDRCWWSTVAYGYRGIVQDMFTWEDWVNYVQVPALGLMPNVVFLFLNQYGRQRGTVSDDITRANYLHLAEDNPLVVEIIPDLGPGEVTAFISGALYRRGIVEAE